MNVSKNKVLWAYIGIMSVILVWGFIPLAKKALIGGAFSASIYSAVTTFASACVLLIVSRKSLSKLDKSYFKLAVPTGVAIGAAVICQALAYNFDASPTNQAFLENLYCIVVPIILFIITRKKPSLITIASCLLCLLSSMVLAGVFSTGIEFATADILNALAGLFYGINIALTGLYAKKFVTSLYIMIQLFIQAIFSGISAIVFNFLEIGGAVVDPFVFTPDILLILAVIGIGVLSNAVCWTVRTLAMKHVSPSVVAVISPFSAVVTGVAAVMVGQDQLSPSLIIGAILGLVASLASSIGDLKESGCGTAGATEDCETELNAFSDCDNDGSALEDVASVGAPEAGVSENSIS